MPPYSRAVRPAKLVPEKVAAMEAINYRSLAEEWLDHVAQQYKLTRLSARDLPIIEHFLRAGFTLVAVRDAKKFLRVDFLAKRCRQKKRVTPSPASQR
jgi:hypothetical protein